jgi:hypothetical protein
MDLETLLITLRKFGVKRIVFETEKPKDIELFEYNILPAAENSLDKMINESDERRCKCGHLEETEHNASGCLQGCPVENCIVRVGPS